MNAHPGNRAQNLAIAYAIKRRGHKMAKGGSAEMCAHGGPAHCMEGCYAEGGFVEEEEQSGYMGHSGNDVKHNAAAMHEDDRDLNQHGQMEEGPQGHEPGEEEEGLAHGGFIGSHATAAHDEDMVGRIMKQRQHMYSKGGRVANKDGITAGFEPNEFDDLANRDDLEFNYTGANSGDEDGNSEQDHLREDDVERMMRQRAMKRNHNPRPA